MKTLLLKIFSLLFIASFFVKTGFSQKAKTNLLILSEIPNSAPPFRYVKRTLRSESVEFIIEKKIPDEIYNDLQGTNIVSHAYMNSDLFPSLYWKSTVPNTNFQLGILEFGGCTDCRVQRIFIVDSLGDVKDCIETVYWFSGITTLQFSLTMDYKLITYRLLPVSSSAILYSDVMNDESKTVECYRLDTTYRINGNGRFEKESEQKHPVKAYTVKEMYEKNVWEL